MCNSLRSILCTYFIFILNFCAYRGIRVQITINVIINSRTRIIMLLWPTGYLQKVMKELFGDGKHGHVIRAFKLPHLFHSVILNHPPLEGWRYCFIFLGNHIDAPHRSISLLGKLSLWPPKIIKKQ